MEETGRLQFMGLQSQMWQWLNNSNIPIITSVSLNYWKPSCRHDFLLLLNNSVCISKTQDILHIAIWTYKSENQHWHNITIQISSSIQISLTVPTRALSLQAQVAIKGRQHLVVISLQTPLSGAVPRALHFLGCSSTCMIWYFFLAVSGQAFLAGILQKWHYALFSTSHWSVTRNPTISILVDFLIMLPSFRVIIFSLQFSSI